MVKTDKAIRLKPLQFALDPGLLQLALASTVSPELRKVKIYIVRKYMVNKGKDKWLTIRTESMKWRY